MPLYFRLIKYGCKVKSRDHSKLILVKHHGSNGPNFNVDAKFTTIERIEKKKITLDNITAIIETRSQLDKASYIT